MKSPSSGPGQGWAWGYGPSPRPRLGRVRRRFNGHGLNRALKTRLAPYSKMCITWSAHARPQNPRATSVPNGRSRDQRTVVPNKCCRISSVSSSARTGGIFSPILGEFTGNSTPRTLIEILPIDVFSLHRKVCLLGYHSCFNK